MGLEDLRQHRPYLGRPTLVPIERRRGRPALPLQSMNRRIQFCVRVIPVLRDLFHQFIIYSRFPGRTIHRFWRARRNFPRNRSLKFSNPGEIIPRIVQKFFMNCAMNGTVKVRIFKMIAAHGPGISCWHVKS